MSLIVFFVILGTVLLCLEVFVPGAILGIFGGIAMLVACVIAGIEHGTTGVLITFVAAAAIACTTLYFEFRLLPKTALGRKMFIHSSVESTSHPPVAPPSVVGQIGRAVTPLSPTGVVVVAGKNYEAFSQSGFIAKDAEVRVAAVDNFRIIITKL